MKDLCLSHHLRLFDLVMKENRRQLDKWGIQDHTIFEWLAYATEELGELSKAISEYEYRDGLPEAVVSEAIETATLCIKVAEMYQFRIEFPKCEDDR